MNSLSSKSKPIAQFLLSKSKSPSSSSSKIFCISFFSSYCSSSSSNLPSPSRRHDEESKNVRVSVWWDIENCGVPSGINVFKISHFITSAVRVNGIKGPVQVTAFGDILSLNRAFQEALSSTGVNLVHIPQGGKNSADRSLLVDLMYWISQNPPPAHIFLISGDKDFAGILHKLRMNNYNILLSGKEGKQTPGVLCSSASIMWHWNELARGEGLSGRHFNHPPDGPYNSWYGHYKGPLEDPFEVSEASEQNCSFEVDNLSNAELSLKSKCRPVPLPILRQLRRIINSYPEGLSFNELQYAITKHKVLIDKDFYGYKKLSHFLQSIPHVVKVESCQDGQYYLRPVPRKVREPVQADVPSSGLVTEEKIQDVEVTRKANDRTPTITRMVDVEPKLPVSSYVNCGESTTEKKGRKETPVTSENKASDALQGDNQVSSTKELLEKEAFNAEVVEIPGDPKEERDSKSNIGFFRRLWYGEGVDTMERNSDIPGNLNASSGIPEMSTSEEIKSTNQHVSQLPTHSSSSTALNEDVNSNNFDKSEARLGLVTRIIGWFKSWRSSTVKAPIKESSEETGFTEEKSRKFDDGLHSKKHKLFSNETFWSSLQSFFRTPRASGIVLSSTSRDQIAERLQKDGPSVLRSVQESDFRYLVDLLVSEKRWIAEFPTKTPRFRIIHSPVGVTPELQPQSVQPHTSNGLSLIFKSSSSQENPQSRIVSAVHNKPSRKSRSEVLADCQSLLDELLSQNAEGFNLGRFKTYFHEKYKYNLDHQKLGYPKLVSLLQIMPGVRIESAHIYSDKVVFSPGIESLGITNKSSGSDSDSSQKNEDANSPWEELGPMASESSNPTQANGNYEEFVSDDDEFSELKEGAAKAEDQKRARVNEDDSSLIQILDSWYDTSDPQYPGSQPTGFKDCSKEEFDTSIKEVDCSRKQRPQKNYVFVTDLIEKNDKLIDGILGSSKKSGESKIQE